MRLCYVTGPYEEMRLTLSSPITSVVRAMAAADSGLEIRDRMWLKITIPNAFIGEPPNWGKYYHPQRLHS